MALSERNVQTALWWRLYKTGGFMVPNYTPAGWFENDVWYVSKAGFACEFEIKLTRSDFRNDAQKTLPLLQWSKDAGKDTLKYAQLSSGHTAGPSKFVYVAPAGVIPLEEVPPWAGLWEFNPSRTIDFKIIRKARWLHHERVKDTVMQHARGVFYWRLWNLRTRLHPDTPPYTAPPVPCDSNTDDTNET